jgi:Domain of unknown function (DUF4112)
MPESPFNGTVPVVPMASPHRVSDFDRSNLVLLRRWAVLLDSAFRVPGTGIRFGIDALIGLVPGIGDLAAPVFTGMLLVTGFRMRLPAVVQARMVLNAALDMLVGLVPFLGDLVDVAWKANLRNLALLERHARPGVPPGRGDYLFVFVCLAVIALVTIVPIVLVVWLLSRFPLV